MQYVLVSLVFFKYELVLLVLLKYDLVLLILMQYEVMLLLLLQYRLVLLVLLNYVLVLLRLVQCGLVSLVLFKCELVSIGCNVGSRNRLAVHVLLPDEMVVLGAVLFVLGHHTRLARVVVRVMWLQLWMVIISASIELDGFYLRLICPVVIIYLVLRLVWGKYEKPRRNQH